MICQRLCPIFCILTCIAYYDVLEKIGILVLHSFLCICFMLLLIILINIYYKHFRTYSRQSYGNRILDEMEENIILGSYIIIKWG